MRGIFRRIRGAIGNGLVWAGAWVLGQLALVIVPVLVSGMALDVLRVIPMLLASAATTGFINGVMFSVVFGLANRRRTLDEIQPLRTGLLGLGAGAAIPVVQFGVITAMGFSLPLSGFVMGLVIGGGLGTATAVGSLKLAQAAAARELADARRADPALPPGTASAP